MWNRSAQVNDSDVGSKVVAPVGRYVAVGKELGRRVFEGFGEAVGNGVGLDDGEDDVGRTKPSVGNGVGEGVPVGGCVNDRGEG